MYESPFELNLDISNYIPGAEIEADDDEPAEGIELGPAYPWEGTDRDYKYEEVWLRIYLLIVHYFLVWIPFHWVSTLLQRCSRSTVQS